MKLADKLDTLHKWSEKKTLRYESEHWITGKPEYDEFDGKECEVCGAIDIYGHAQYDACDIMAGYPASESPCLCTGRKYAEAHGLEYKPGGDYE